jgi:hypothetical protein
MNSEDWKRLFSRTARMPPITAQSSAAPRAKVDEIFDVVLARVDGAPEAYWTLAELVALERYGADQKILVRGEPCFVVKTRKAAEIEQIKRFNDA